MVKNVLAQILTACTWADTPVPNSREIISLEHYVFLVLGEIAEKKPKKTTGDVKVDASGQPQFSPVRPQFISGESSGLSKVLRQSSPTRPLITCRWASLMPVYISAA